MTWTSLDTLESSAPLSIVLQRERHSRSSHHAFDGFPSQLECRGAVLSDGLPSSLLPAAGHRPRGATSPSYSSSESVPAFRLDGAVLAMPRAVGATPHRYAPSLCPIATPHRRPFRGRPAAVFFLFLPGIIYRQQPRTRCRTTSSCAGESGSGQRSCHPPNCRLWEPGKIRRGRERAMGHDRHYLRGHRGAPDRARHRGAGPYLCGRRR